MTDPIFTPRHGLRYRWWRDVRWDIVVSVIAIVALYLMLAAALFAWAFDWKPSW